MYHVFQLEDTASLYQIVWSELKKHGIKETGRCRKQTKIIGVSDSSSSNFEILILDVIVKFAHFQDMSKKNLFGQPLELLKSDRTLIMVEAQVEANSEQPNTADPLYVKGDVLTSVPSFVVECCQAILRGAQVEGLFRKAGSAARQREMRKQFEKGEAIKVSHDVIDLANILKQFLRDLPEPLIPRQLHEILLK